MSERIKWDQDGVSHKDEPPQCPNCKKMQQDIDRLIDELSRTRQLMRMYVPI